MDNQSVLPQVFVQRLALVAIAIGLCLGAWFLGVYLYQISDPYIHHVLSTKGDPERGNAIFQINCAGCHGTYATGNVGPSLESLSKRKSDVAIVQQVISGKTPPMPKFQPNYQDMADLLHYLKRL